MSHGMANMPPQLGICMHQGVEDLLRNYPALDPSNGTYYFFHSESTKCRPTSQQVCQMQTWFLFVSLLTRQELMV